jgi:hypothetical protein
MIKCRVCGANCDAGDLVNLVCEDCRSPEVEFHQIKHIVYTRGRKAYEEIERRKEDVEFV